MRLQHIIETRNLASTDFGMFTQFQKLAEISNGLFNSPNQASKMKSVLDGNNQFTISTTIRHTNELPARTTFVVTCDNKGVTLITRSVDRNKVSVVWRRT